MINDINFGGVVNVFKDIVVIVECGMVCLDNEKFWGVLNVICVVIWILLLGVGEGKFDLY